MLKSLMYINFTFKLIAAQRVYFYHLYYNAILPTILKCPDPDMIEWRYSRASSRKPAVHQQPRKTLNNRRLSRISFAVRMRPCLSHYPFYANVSDTSSQCEIHFPRLISVHSVTHHLINISHF